MCTADVAQSNFLNQATASSSAKTVRSRFAMKLPRYNNAFSSSKTSSHARGGGSSHAADATPRVANKTGDNVHANKTAASGFHAMRRSQSANPSRLRPRGIVAGMREHSMHKSRSNNCAQTRHNDSFQQHHQQHQSSTSSSRTSLRQQTRELPIPACRDLNARDQREVDQPLRSADRNDLTRMYDYATWNMYERIVSARRHRLQVDPQRPSSEKMDGANDDDKAATPAARQRRPLTQPLIKTSSHGDESLGGTADETDKSSTASSSWSRNDSPVTYPGQTQFVGQGGGAAMPTLPNLDRLRAGCRSCPPPSGHGGPSDEDDSFIFQLDM